jgi:hypothetical protein
VQAFQVSSEGFQGGFVSRASIVGRGGKETSEGERFDISENLTNLVRVGKWYQCTGGACLRCIPDRRCWP